MSLWVGCFWGWYHIGLKKVLWSVAEKNLGKDCKSELFNIGI